MQLCPPYTTRGLALLLGAPLRDACLARMRATRSARKPPPKHRQVRRWPRIVQHVRRVANTDFGLFPVVYGLRWRHPAHPFDRTGYGNALLARPDPHAHGSRRRQHTRLAVPGATVDAKGLEAGARAGSAWIAAGIGAGPCGAGAQGGRRGDRAETGRPSRGEGARTALRQGPAIAGHEEGTGKRRKASDWRGGVRDVARGLWQPPSEEAWRLLRLPPKGE